MARSQSRRGRARHAGKSERAARPDARGTAAHLPDPASPGDRPGPPPASPRWLFTVSLALAILNILIYAPVRQHPFIGFDDPQYVAENRHVATGVTLENVAWAFRSGEEGNWHPLTWISHMLDVQLFGLEPGAHHLTNVGLHVANTLLLLLLLVALTGAKWPSALVAALFAVHPMHVESVAWIAERKDVLSALFWTATLLSYTAYAHAPSRGRYLATLALFTAGLMSKPMVVTLPCVLLLVDLWPLGRVAPTFSPLAWWPLVREKLPFFALTAAASVVTFLVQQAGGAVKSVETLSVGRRVETALVGYQSYISRLVWPRDLAVLYPFPDVIPLWTVATAVVGLGLVTVLAFRSLRERPWLAVGWLWFLGTLVPVSGLVQVGSQPFANRFTYIPYTGLFIVIAWAGAAAVRRRPAFVRVAWPAAVFAIAGLSVAARAEVQYWRDGITLWTRALEVTERNYRAHSALGFALSSAGRDEDAAAQYEAALAIRPAYGEALVNLGGIRSEQGDFTAAESLLQAALAVDANYPEALANLGATRVRQGRVDEGIGLLERARALEPYDAEVHNALGYALVSAGRFDEALTALNDAIRLRPGYADAHGNLGLLLGDEGRLDAAMAAFRKALELDPDHARSHYGLGAVLDDSGRFDEAIVELRAAVDRDPSLAEAHNRLGRVLVRLGRIDESIPAFEAAVRARPAEPDFHYDLGVMLIKANRPEEATREFEAALRLEPGHRDTLQVLRAMGRIR